MFLSWSSSASACTTRGCFGANYDPDKDLHFVLINPGLSHLSARQILDRLLGI